MPSSITQVGPSNSPHVGSVRSTSPTADLRALWTWTGSSDGRRLVIGGKVVDRRDVRRQRQLPRTGLRYDQPAALGALLRLDARLGTRHADRFTRPGGLWDRWVDALPTCVATPAGPRRHCAHGRTASATSPTAGATPGRPLRLTPPRAVPARRTAWPRRRCQRGRPENGPTPLTCRFACSA
ncbi:DUF6000 family protein [Streptomyces thermocarboxydus]